MPKTKSEKQTAILSKNTFLNMYVYSNPKMKSLTGGPGGEFCDCLIHMANVDIVIQVKSNEDANAKNWFVRQVRKKARKQLETSVRALCSPDYEVWDKCDTICLNKGAKDPNTIFPVIVFEKDDQDFYQQVISSDESRPDGAGRFRCNIFSMRDFQYATSMIPTGVDFIDYLSFRLAKLERLEPGCQLYPFFRIGNETRSVKNADGNEQIMVSEFLYQKFKDPNSVVKNARMWQRNLSGLEDARTNPKFIQLLSYLSMEQIEKWDNERKRLIAESWGSRYVWTEDSILNGRVDGQTYGLLLSYVPVEFSENWQSDGDQLVEQYAKKAIKENGFDGAFVFQYSKTNRVRIVEFDK